MKNYWPLPLIILILFAILGMSQYADNCKPKYEESHRQAKSTTVTEDTEHKSSDPTNEAYQPPLWGKYVTFPEGIGAWAIAMTLLAIIWQSIEARKQATIGRQALVSQFRPRIIVRRLLFIYPDEGSPRIDFTS